MGIVACQKDSSSGVSPFDMSKTTTRLGALLALLFCANIVQQSSSVVINFDNPDLWQALEDLLTKNNITHTWEEVFECLQEPSPCGDHTRCQDVEFSYECVCHDGYKSHEDEESNSCFDVDECVVLENVKKTILDQLDEWIVELDNCHEKGTLVCGVSDEDIDDFVSSIESNYTRFDVVRAGRNSIFEIYSDSFSSDLLNNLTSFLPCDAFASCSNLNGSYHCECEGGFAGNKTECLDVNECENVDSVCHPTSVCRNKVGGFSCDCVAGQEYDGETEGCKDRDECDDDDTNDCSPNSDCINTEGSYTCVCFEGFTQDGFNCLDINECEDPTLFDCSSKANCINTNGSYSCACKEGYFGDGRTCVDDVIDDTCPGLSLPNCGNSTTLSCGYQMENEIQAQRVFETFRYFFVIPDIVKATVCNSSSISDVLASGHESSLFHSSADSTKICDTAYDMKYRRFAYLDETATKPVELYHFKDQFQWFETRTCITSHDHSSPIGCAQRFLSQRALIIQKFEGNYEFDVKQVYLESGCEVDVFF